MNRDSVTIFPNKRAGVVFRELKILISLKLLLKLPSELPKHFRIAMMLSDVLLEEKIYHRQYVSNPVDAFSKRDALIISDVGPKIADLVLQLRIHNSNVCEVPFGLRCLK